MLLPANVLLRALSTEVHNLGASAEGSGAASSRQSVDIALHLLLAREERGGDAMRTQCTRLISMFRGLATMEKAPVAASSSIITGKFAQGRIADLKMVQLPHMFIPLFLRAAQAAIESTPGSQ